MCFYNNSCFLFPNLEIPICFKSESVKDNNTYLNEPNSTVSRSQRTTSDTLHNDTLLLLLLFAFAFASVRAKAPDLAIGNKLLPLSPRDKMYLSVTLKILGSKI